MIRPDEARRISLGFSVVLFFSVAIAAVDVAKPGLREALDSEESGALRGWWRGSDWPDGWPVELRKCFEPNGVTDPSKAPAPYEDRLLLPSDVNASTCEWIRPNSSTGSTGSPGT